MAWIQHTAEHVLGELENFKHLVPVGNYIVVFDTNIAEAEEWKTSNPLIANGRSSKSLSSGMGSSRESRRRRPTLHRLKRRDWDRTSDSTRVKAG